VGVCVCVCVCVCVSVSVFASVFVSVGVCKLSPDLDSVACAPSWANLSEVASVIFPLS